MSSGASALSRAIAFAFAIALGAVSCSAPPDCSPFVACGGDVTGAWTIAGTCRRPTTSACGAKRDVAQSFAGAITFNVDGTYSLNAAVSASGTATLPAACLSPPPSQCAVLDGDSNGVITKCTGDPASACTCTINEASGSSSESGRYTASATNLTLAPSGDVAYGGAYCANAHELRIDLANAVGEFIVVLLK